MSKISVLIAGIGGASLGTEIFKCLKMLGRYTIYGCDISEFAYGHYIDGFEKTFVVKRENYVDSVREICLSYGIKVIIPGGEEPLNILGPLSSDFEKLGIYIAANSAEVITKCANKSILFMKLEELGIPIPKTIAFGKSDDIDRIDNIPFPCVIKPAIGTGGSHLVSLAEDPDEARIYLKRILMNCGKALIQEYIPLDEGEFTVGVLSFQDGSTAGSIAMKRLFHTKLSISIKTKTGLISSGYSQGLIDDFPEVQAQAERIAKALESKGPLNIQGRVRNNIFYPFEINPRFSASTYLRALAGFNEIDIYIRYILMKEKSDKPQIRFGYYLRSLDEIYVPKDGLKQ